MPTDPLVNCWYDHCCIFQPGSHNAKYCLIHNCKRKAEAARKRLVAEDDPDNRIEDWQLQERKKIGTSLQALEKNAWLLDNARIGFFDIETTNLEASIGMILSACIKYRGNDNIVTVESKHDGSVFDDRDTCIQLRNELENCDYVVTFYGTGFDIPYINTRLLIAGERPINQLRHIDVYYTARTHLKLHSNRLQIVAETLGVPTEKTRVLGPVWTRAAMGDLEALSYITDHCQKDVRVLEEVFEKLKGFVNFSATRWRRFGASY